MPAEIADHCLVVLTDPLYLPGTLRAIESWLQWNGPCPIVALSRKPEVFRDPALQRFGPQCRSIDDPAFGRIKAYRKRRSRRHAETFYKFYAFSDFGYERNIFIDSDVLCLRPAPLLCEDSKSDLLAALDTGFRKTRAYKGHPIEINSGVMAINRAIQGPATVAKLIAIAEEEPGRGGYNAGDQGIINKWMHREALCVTLLPPDYNLLKSDYEDESGLDSCRLLHFTGRKPWFDRARHDGTLRPPATLEKLWTGEAALHRHGTAL